MIGCQGTFLLCRIARLSLLSTYSSALRSHLHSYYKLLCVAIGPACPAFALVSERRARPPHSLVLVVIKDQLTWPEHSAPCRGQPIWRSEAARSRRPRTHRNAGLADRDQPLALAGCRPPRR
ncbi:hypothetical protein C2E23DRAFT_826974 [Lenzites betulinus]|nr:hypothetical protein C2E23DRAFT_826974 [Lenzites betulinus]